MKKHLKISMPLLASAVILLILSYFRFFSTGKLSLEAVFPDPTSSTILFILFLFSTLLCFYGYYQAVFNSVSLNFTKQDIRWLAYGLSALSLMTLPVLSSDIFIYLACGDISAQTTLNPYTDFQQFSQSPFFQYVSPTWNSQPFCKYGPVNLLTMHITSLLSFRTIFVALFNYKLLMLFIGILFIELMYRFTHWKLGSSRPEIFPFIVLSPIFWIQGVGQAHNDLIVAVIIIPGLYFMLRHKYTYSMIFFSVAVSAKIYAVLTIPMLLYYIYLHRGLTIELLKQSLYTILILFITSILFYLPFWNGIETITTPYKALFSEGTMHTLSYIIGRIIIELSNLKLYSKEIYSISRWVIALPAIILGLYIVNQMRNHQEEFIYLVGKGFILLFCFYVARYHNWYFIMALPFFVGAVSRQWFWWGVIVFTWGNFVDMYNFIDHNMLLLHIALPTSLLFVNGVFLWKIKSRFIKI